MVLAAIGDTGYNIMLLVHVLAMVVAFAPAFVWPIVAVRQRKAGQDADATINQLSNGTTMTIYGPALAVGGLVGFGVAGMSKPGDGMDPIYSMSQAWLMVAAFVWLVLLGIYFGLLAPAQKKIAAGDASAAKMVPMLNGITHLLVLVALYLMVFKPGL